MPKIGTNLEKYYKIINLRPSSETSKAIDKDKLL